MARTRKPPKSPSKTKFEQEAHQRQQLEHQWDSTDPPYRATYWYWQLKQPHYVSETIHTIRTLGKPEPIPWTEMESFYDMEYNSITYKIGDVVNVLLDEPSTTDKTKHPALILNIRQPTSDQIPNEDERHPVFLIAWYYNVFYARDAAIMSTDLDRFWPKDNDGHYGQNIYILSTHFQVLYVDAFDGEPLKEDALTGFHEDRFCLPGGELKAGKAFPLSKCRKDVLRNVLRIRKRLEMEACPERIRSASSGANFGLGQDSDRAGTASTRDMVPKPQHGIRKIDQREQNFVQKRINSDFVPIRKKRGTKKRGTKERGAKKGVTKKGVTKKGSTKEIPRKRVKAKPY